MKLHCVPKNVQRFICQITLSENLTSVACTVAHLTCIISSVYIIAEENKLLPPYPPYLNNVTTLPRKMHNSFYLTEGMLHSFKRWWL